MSIHIKLAATATGDAITAISTTVKVAKDADVEIDLLIQNINIRVRPTSDVQDIIEIYRLKSNKDKNEETGRWLPILYVYSLLAYADVT